MSETLSPPCVLWASAGHGKVEIAEGDQLGEGAPLLERHRNKSPPSGISLC